MLDVKFAGHKVAKLSTRSIFMKIIFLITIFIIAWELPCNWNEALVRLINYATSLLLIWEGCVSQFGNIPQMDPKCKYIHKKPPFHTRCFENEDKNNPLQPQLNQHCDCLYLVFVSDILCLLPPFIEDLVPKVAAGLAINSSSMKYCFLSRWGLAQQQCLAGKSCGC